MAKPALLTCLLFALLATAGCTRAVTQSDVADLFHQRAPYTGTFPSTKAGWWYMGSDVEWHYLAWIQESYDGPAAAKFKKMDRVELQLKEMPFSEDPAKWRRLTWDESGLTSH